MRVDNCFTGQKSNILHLLNNPYYELLRHDITFPLYTEVDAIYNHAPPASSKIVYQPRPQDDPVRRRPDINLAKYKIGWEPVIYLEKGLKKKYYEELVSKSGS